MNIGHASRQSGVPAKTIRYYESIGLTRPPRRSGNGYRMYAEDNVHILRFVAQARSLGFSIDDCRSLLALYEDRSRASADVKRIAEHHIGEIENKIGDLQAMRATLRELSEKCHGDDRPDCPILDKLSQSARPSA